MIIEGLRGVGLCDREGYQTLDFRTSISSSKIHWGGVLGAEPWRRVPRTSIVWVFDFP